MKAYTIIGYWEDSTEITTYCVEATNECGAVQRCIYPFDKDRQRTFMVVGIFEGDHLNLNECPTVSAAADWK